MVMMKGKWEVLGIFVFNSLFFVKFTKCSESKKVWISRMRGKKGIGRELGRREREFREAKDKSRVLGMETLTVIGERIGDKDKEIKIRR